MAGGDFLKNLRKAAAGKISLANVPAPKEAGKEPSGNLRRKRQSTEDDEVVEVQPTAKALRIGEAEAGGGQHVARTSSGLMDRSGKGKAVLGASPPFPAVSGSVSDELDICLLPDGADCTELRKRSSAHHLKRIKELTAQAASLAAYLESPTNPEQARKEEMYKKMREMKDELTELRKKVEVGERKLKEMEGKNHELEVKQAEASSLAEEEKKQRGEAEENLAQYAAANDKLKGELEEAKGQLAVMTHNRDELADLARQANTEAFQNALDQLLLSNPSVRLDLSMLHPERFVKDNQLFGLDEEGNEYPLAGSEVQSVGPTAEEGRVEAGLPVAEGEGCAQAESSQAL